MTDAPRGPRKRSLFALLGDIPTLLSDLVRQEIELLKAELANKAKQAGVGIGLLVVAASFVVCAVGVFTAAAILALAQVLPPWAAALIVGAVLLAGAALLVAAGFAQLKKSSSAPSESMQSIKQDVNTIKGIGKRAGS
jgi:Putative Actinobacterial Holin-X, holin superfamily III